MKAKTASLTLYHFEPGHHREVCQWHDRDHKPEVVGTVPNIFVSQRWVAPPDLLAARPQSALEHNGGEYVNLYWSSGTPSELAADFAVLGRRLELVGRMEPMRYIHRTWGGRLRPVSAQVRPGLELSPDAVPSAIQNSGLMVVIIELAKSDTRDAYARWHESEHIPIILETGVFSGAVKLMHDGPEGADNDVFVTLYYTDRPDPTAAYAEFRQISAEWPGTGKSFRDADRARKVLHSAMYVPSMGFYDYYD